MPTTPNKGHQNNSGASDKSPRANMSASGKASGSNADLSRTSPQIQGHKPQEGHKSGEHRKP